MFTQTPDSCARSAFAITPANSDLKNLTSMCNATKPTAPNAVA